MELKVEFYAKRSPEKVLKRISELASVFIPLFKDLNILADTEPVLLFTNALSGEKEAVMQQFHESDFYLQVGHVVVTLFSVADEVIVKYSEER